MVFSLKSGLRISLAGMAVNAVLATVKLVAGLIGQSYALVADAIESFADVASSAIVWSGLSISARPPDDNHPYGHGKAEPLAALAVAMMLFAAGIGVAVQAVREIATPHHAPATFTLWVLVVVVAAKETMYRITSRIGDRLDSTAVRADALHHRSDAVTSLLAGIGISIALWGGAGYEAADDWAALLASAVIGFNGIRFARRAMEELMDASPDPGVVSAIGEVAGTVEGVERVEKLLARKMGTRYVVDMHIEVDPLMTVDDAHELAHCVKDRILEREPRVLDVLIHVEPYLGNAASGGSVPG